jgi:hypothetical protein
LATFYCFAAPYLQNGSETARLLVRSYKAIGIIAPILHLLENPTLPVAELEWLLDNGWVIGDSFMAIAISEVWTPSMVLPFSC